MGTIRKRKVGSSLNLSSADAPRDALAGDAAKAKLHTFEALTLGFEKASVARGGAVACQV